MATTLTIRGLDADVKDRLRVRAARHGRSMEEEVRAILRSAVAGEDPSPGRLSDAVRRRFEKLGGVELEVPERQRGRVPPELG